MPLIQAFALLSMLLPLADAARGKLTSYTTICESSSIWSRLTSDPTLIGATNVNFARIDAETSEKMADYKAQIERLKAELESLLPRIAEALEREKIPETSQAQIDELISAAVSGSFGNIETAKSTQCAYPKAMTKEQKRKNKGLRRAYDDSLANFDAVLEKFFTEQGTVIFNGDLWSERFWSEIGKEGYCDQLCQELRDKAVQSAPPPPPPPVSTALQTRQQEIESELLKLEERMKQCDTQRGYIKAFETSLTAHKETENMRHEELRKAENALADVEYELDEVTDDLEEAEQKLEKVIEKLSDEREVVKEAKDTLEELIAEEKEWKDKVDKTTAAVTDVGSKLSATGQADKVVEALRSAVSMTTLKMRLLFEAAALAPVERAGLSGDTVLSEYFFEKLTDVPGETEVSASVDELTTFCTDEAMPVFKKVKEVDLTPLCAVGEASAIKGSIHDSLNLRISQVQKLIKQVQTWFDPLKGQDVSKTDIPTRLAAGEPEGLLQTMSVYSDATFFQYLKGWEYRGLYLELIKQLRDADAELQTSLENLQAQLSTFKDGAAEVKAKREAAEQKLKEAEEKAAITEAEKEELEAAIAALKEQSAKLDAMKGDLEDRVAEAMRALIAAKEALKAHFKEETGQEITGLEWR